MYVVRIQKERFPDPMEYERVRGELQVNHGVATRREGFIDNTTPASQWMRLTSRWIKRGMLGTSSKPP